MVSKLSEAEIANITRVFLARVAATCSLLDIPPDLVVNFDQTGVVLFNPSVYTWEVRGTKRVLRASASTEKAAITAVLATSANNDILPPQLIFTGRTDRCHPEGFESFPDWHITHSETHWSSVQTMKDYVEKVLEPWINRKRHELGRPANHPAMIVLDLWAHHRSDEFVDLLVSKGMFPVFVPGGSTGSLQPQDVSFNRPFKAKLSQQFDDWFISLSPEEKSVSGSLKVCG